MTKATASPPATIVIFGAGGDLTRRLLIPAIVNLQRSRLLGARTDILGIAHGEGDDEALRDHLAQFVEDGPDWQQIRKRISCLNGDFEDHGLYEAIADRLDGNVVFYLATAPGFFAPIVENLGKSGLLDEAKAFAGS